MDDKPIEQPGNAELSPLDALEGNTNSFIVVIRSLPRADDKPDEWLGSVEHAQSHLRMYFRHFSRLIDFITAQSRISILPPPRRGGWSSSAFREKLDSMFRALARSLRP